eukprot:6612980-Pyramimonas_sp.AAC.1
MNSTTAQHKSKRAAYVGKADALTRSEAPISGWYLHPRVLIQLANGAGVVVCPSGRCKRHAH